MLWLVCSGILEESIRTPYLRHSSFLFGTSTNNQPIESLWSISKRQNSAWWINVFKDLQDKGLIDPSLNHHKESLKFCFSGLLESELDNIKEMWNNNRIRNSRNAEHRGGRPDVLYFNLAVAGATDYKFLLAREKRDQPLRCCVYPSLVNCTEDFMPLASLIMIEENLSAPKNIQESKSLCLTLITVIDSF